MNKYIGKIWDWSRTPVLIYRGEAAALWAFFGLTIINHFI